MRIGCLLRSNAPIPQSKDVPAAVGFEDVDREKRHVAVEVAGA
jgi:hypothetical protein